MRPTLAPFAEPNTIEKVRGSGHRATRRSRPGSQCPALIAEKLNLSESDNLSRVLVAIASSPAEGLESLLADSVEKAFTDSGARDSVALRKAE
jgi:hypothetical protein